MRWLGGFPGPLSHPQKEGGGVDLPGPALPPSLNPGLGPSVSVVSVFDFFVFLVFFSWLKYFAKDQVIGEGRGAGAGRNAPISSEAGGVSLLQQQLKRK